MSKLRPECRTNRDGTSLPDDTALFLIRDAVARRRSLIYGRLHKDGKHCAMGAFWTDHPDLGVHTTLVDEVAAVNDSLGPNASPHKRWLKVTAWLKWKLKVMAHDAE